MPIDSLYISFSLFFVKFSFPKLKSVIIRPWCHFSTGKAMTLHSSGQIKYVYAFGIRPNVAILKESQQNFPLIIYYSQMSQTDELKSFQCGDMMLLSIELAVFLFYFIIPITKYIFKHT